MHRWLSRCSTARGAISGISHRGLTQVKARKSFLFTEGSLKVENKEHLCAVKARKSFLFAQGSLKVENKEHLCTSGLAQTHKYSDVIQGVP